MSFTIHNYSYPCAVYRQICAIAMIFCVHWFVSTFVSVIYRVICGLCVCNINPISKPGPILILPHSPMYIKRPDDIIITIIVCVCVICVCHVPIALVFHSLLCARTVITFLSSGSTHIHAVHFLVTLLVTYHTSSSNKTFGFSNGNSVKKHTDSIDNNIMLHDQLSLASI